MRAQTTLDFAAGASVLLVTLTIVLTFTPGLIDPFVGTAQDDPIVANRAASSLVGGELADPERPFILDESAVDTFFDAAANNQTYVRSRLGLAPQTDVNITLRNRTHVLRQVGPVTSSSEDVAVAWRVVQHRGERAELVVRVW